jgi:hypothetical protein
VEGLSAVFVAKITALSISAVRRVVHQGRRPDVPETGEGEIDAPVVEGSYRVPEQDHPRAAPAAFPDESKGAAS